MPEWKKVVREQMTALNLPPGATEDIIAELAEHLAEAYEAARARGLTHTAACNRAMQEVDDWYVLAKEIRRAKAEEEFTNSRSKRLWIPTMVSLLGASLAMRLMQLIGVRPDPAWTAPLVVSFYWPWLAVLPIFGALGAYLSRRSGGPLKFRLVAGTAPVLWLFLLSSASEPIDLAVNGLSQLRYYAYGMADLVLIPGAALLVGALPFLFDSNGQDSPRSRT